MATCEYGACKHRSRHERHACQEALRRARIVRLNTLISSAQQELAQLMADRAYDLYGPLRQDEPPDEQDAGI